MSEPLLRIEDLQVHFRLGREAGVERASRRWAATDGA
jgi:hypothetical protein